MCETAWAKRGSLRPQTRGFVAGRLSERICALVRTASTLGAFVVRREGGACRVPGLGIVHG